MLRPTALANKPRPDGLPLVDGFQGVNPNEENGSPSELGGPWGHLMTRKKENNNVRVALINVNGLAPQKKDVKSKQLKELMKDKCIDVLCINEHNLNLPKLSATEGWRNRFKTQKTHTLAASNIHNTSTSKRIYGGTAHITSAFISPRVKDFGSDHTGLGRWTWVRIEGRNGFTVKIITAYRLV